MALINFRKETSERSDVDNWAKSLLVKESGLYLESIEGCNQNADNIVTHLIERARVDDDNSKPSTQDEIISSIISLEGKEVLERKINFAKCFDLPLTYTLYCDETQNILLFNFISLEQVDFVQGFTSYQEFSNWILKIKGWKSTKEYREIQDLPFFDKALRKCGTPWPTNIDCFVCDTENNPIAILEFQNANNTNVANHCNNDFFLCKISVINRWGYKSYHDDIRRWTSQEILRVQSNLRYLIITWAKNEDDFILKEVEIITIPFFPNINENPDWNYINKYKDLLNKYTVSGKSELHAKDISDKFKTYNLKNNEGIISSIVNEPPLSYENKTFPSIYYQSKELIKENREILASKFVELLNS